MPKLTHCLILGLSTCFMFGTAVAQDNLPVGLSETMLFHWYTDAGPDWALAFLFAGLGLFGALITTFSVIGGVLPGTAGKVRIDKEQSQLDELQAKLSKLVEQKPPDAKVIEAVANSLTSMRTELRKERWRQYWLGFTFYILIGAVFANAVARDMIQAVLLGAGWTSFLGIFGLKKDFSVRKSAKDEILKQAEHLVAELESEMHQTIGSTDTGTASGIDVPQFRKDIKAAQTL